VDIRYYLQALAAAGLFIFMVLVVWVASGGAATEAEIRNAVGTRTAIAETAQGLLKPFSTPTAFTATPSPTPGFTPTGDTPLPTVAASLPAFPTRTAIAPIPTMTVPVTPLVPETGADEVQDPAEFARWYFTRVWRERDYANLWNNYLTTSYKANVGSGIFEDYVGWWDSVERVDVDSVDVIENNGTDAWVRVILTFHMKDGRVVPNQINDYDFWYDASRRTWMFDYGT